MAITIRFDSMTDVNAFMKGVRLAPNPNDLMSMLDVINRIPFSAPAPDDLDDKATADATQDTAASQDSSDQTGTLLTLRDIDLLDAGTRVSWVGAKFQFTGTLVDDTDDNDNGDMFIRICRDDTGKVVKVTFDANETGKLYKL